MQSKGWFPLLAAAFLATALTASAQRGSNWRVYKAADGLPETLTWTVSVGPREHVWTRHPSVTWIGRLDGYDVQAIPAPGLGNSRIYESPSGQIWTFTADGLQQYVGGERGWVQYDVPEVLASLRRNRVGPFYQVDLLPVRQNQVLILSPEGLVQFTADEKQPSQTISLHAARRTGLGKFTSMCAARDGGLWIASANGVAKLVGPLRTLTAESPLLEYLAPPTLHCHNFNRPVEDVAGGVTMVAESTESTKAVVVHFDGQQWTVEDRETDRLVEAWREADSSDWVATLHALETYHQTGAKADATQELSQHNFDVAVETSGIFWIATTEGLLRYAPLTWQGVGVDGSSNTPIASIGEDAAGRLFVLLDNSLALRHNDTWKTYPVPSATAKDSHETDVSFALTNGTVVLQSGASLQVFNAQSGNFASVSDQTSTRLKALGLLKNGTLCVQTFEATGAPGPLEVFDGTNLAPFPYSLPEKLSHNSFRFVFTSYDGSIWLGGENGLARFADKQWQNFTTANTTFSEPPNCMLEMSDGKIWCGVQDKIMQFNGQNWSIVRAGFYQVNAMLKARDGSVWVASENGLHRFYRGGWSANGVEEGLLSDAVHHLYEDSRGQIWAATSRGLNRYHPEADIDPPRTYVQNLPGANNTIREGSSVIISFSGQDKWKYTPPDRLLFSYRLDGQEWSPYQEQGSATFLDLPAGKHSFYVRSMDRNWNVDPKPAELHFAITLPWYRETRLLLISAGGLGLAIFFAGVAFNRHRQLLRSYTEVEAKVALRTQQLELANRELFHSQKMNALGTLAAGIAHDFNSILSIIKGSAQIIEDNLDNTDKIRTRTDRIKTVVEQGAGIVKAMLGFSRDSERQLVLCNINAIVQETISLLGDRFLRETQVKFIPGPESLPEVPGSKDFIQQILLNFIFNAAEAMTEHHRVIISATESDKLPPALALKPEIAASYVFLAVKDFGSGIKPEVMPRIFEPFFTTKALSAKRGTGLGLSMVYELARRMDGGLHVESKPGEGSVFTLILPVRKLPVETRPQNG